jgi:4-hydroxy-tetrahydrodipicolinate synthase
VFEGSICAIVTPFRDGRVDLDAFAALVEWQIASGTSGICVAGTTGEGATLRPEERDALVRRAVEVARGRAPVLAGTGTNATWSTVEQTRAARASGAAAALVVTPYYNKPSQEGLYRHFRAVAEAAEGLPIVLYDVPGRTAVTIAEATIERLARVPGIVALKDATGDVERMGRLARSTPLALLCGDDALALPAMRAGARGVVSVAANVVPAAMAALCRERSDALHERLLPLFRALFLESNPIPVKHALAAIGRIRDELRLPLTPLDPRHHPALRAALQGAGAL